MDIPEEKSFFLNKWCDKNLIKSKNFNIEFAFTFN